MNEERDELDLMIERETQRQAAEDGGSSSGDNGANNQAGQQGQQQQQTPADTSGQQNQQQQQTPAEKPGDDNGQQQQQQQVEAPNYDKIFEEISGGLFKSADEFKAALPKIQTVDTVQQQVDALQKKLDEAYADDYEKQRNELKRNGATKEQLKAFETINDLGDLKDLDPIEAKVQKLILVDGYSEKVARRMVDRDFPLDTAEEEDLDELKEKLRISVKTDLEALQAFKVNQSTPPTDKNLVNALQKQQIETQITPVLNQFVESFSTLEKLNLTGKEGNEAVDFNIDIPADVRKEVAGDIKAYFVENSMPVTQENYNEALSYAKDRFISSNIGKIAQDIWAKADAHFTKLYSDKYSNSSGLPKGDQKQNGGKTADDVAHENWKRSELGVDLNSGY